MNAWKPFSFLPEFAGEVTFDEVPADVFRRIERRVSEGLMSGTMSRNQYRVVSSGQGTLEIEAMDNATAWSMGLNRVTLRRAGARAVGYKVTFWRWTTCCVAIAGCVGAMLALISFVPGVREKLSSYPHGVACYFGLVAFWALGWPWCLTVIHRPFARRALERVLRETIESRPHARRAA